MRADSHHECPLVESVPESVWYQLRIAFVLSPRKPWMPALLRSESEPEVSATSDELDDEPDDEELPEDEEEEVWAGADEVVVLDGAVHSEEDEEDEEASEPPLEDDDHEA